MDVTVARRAGWVNDLGANRGLFSVWTAVNGAQVVAVDAQRGFGPEIERLAEYNGVGERVHVEIAVASGMHTSGPAVGVVADDRRWATTSHGAPERPADVSVPELMFKYRIDRGRAAKGRHPRRRVRRLRRRRPSVARRHRPARLRASSEFRISCIANRPNPSPCFVTDLRDNEGMRVGVNSSRLEYTYCSRV
jgi:hypothetical protein